MPLTIKVPFQRSRYLATSSQVKAPPISLLANATMSLIDAFSPA